MREIYIVVPRGTIIYGASTSLQGAIEKAPADDTVEAKMVYLTEDGD